MLRGALLLVVVVAARRFVVVVTSLRPLIVAVVVVVAMINESLPWVGGVHIRAGGKGVHRSVVPRRLVAACRVVVTVTRLMARRMSLARLQRWMVMAGLLLVLVGRSVVAVVTMHVTMVVGTGLMRRRVVGTGPHSLFLLPYLHLSSYYFGLPLGLHQPLLLHRGRGPLLL